MQDAVAQQIRRGTALRMPQSFANTVVGIFALAPHRP